MKKVFLIFLMALALAVSLPQSSFAALTSGQISAILNLLQSFGADQSVINNVQTSLTGGSPTTPTTGAWCYNFNTNLRAGSTGPDVSALQTALIKEGIVAGFKGSGLPTFDESTASAVTGFQEKYASDILTPSGLKYGTGFAGNATRSKLNSLYGCNGIATPPVSTQSLNANSSNPNMSGGLCPAGQSWVSGSGCQGQPSIAITYPSTGFSFDDSGAKGNGNSPIMTIQWNEQNGNYPVSIYLLDQNNQIVRTITQSTSNTGSYVWAYDSTLPNGTYQLRMDIIYSGKGGPTSAYSGYFTVANSPASPANVGPTTISFIYPQTGYSLDDSGAKGNGNSPIATIQWNEQNGNYPVSLYLLNQNNQVVRTIATNIADTGSYVWQFDSTLPDGTYQLRIDVLYPSGASGQDFAYSGYFTTANSPVSQLATPVSLTVTYPQTGYSLDDSGAKGNGNSPIATIQWNEQNGDYPVFIYLLNSSNQIVKNIAQSVPDTGSYVWQYDPTLPNGTYQIQISVAYPGKGGPTNAYSGYFTVTNSPTQ